MILPIYYIGLAAVCAVAALLEYNRELGRRSAPAHDDIGWLKHNADELAKGNFPQLAEERIREIAAQKEKPKKA